MKASFSHVWFVVVLPLAVSNDENLDELIKLIKREVSRWEAIEMDGFLNVSQYSQTCGELFS